MWLIPECLASKVLKALQDEGSVAHCLSGHIPDTDYRTEDGICLLVCEHSYGAALTVLTRLQVPRFFFNPKHPC